ncbi:vacuolar protein-sorting-associated protein 36-like [Sycon ciliatum]|uniref:vacuolar protein-sorting-associated protein 36-like n=1 Tax=Sycon ciliatum TaxID=27933 RepID=UPI0020ADE0E8|eukprot:scpid65793/ scgid10474/ Vacuolar protein-sorting-associated protein 36; ESCRT-II complex subunit VPS36
MDRLTWCDESLLPGEVHILQQASVRIYDGEDRTSFEAGALQLTSHRVIWDDQDQDGRTLCLHHSFIMRLEDVRGSLTKSNKIAAFLQPAPSSRDVSQAVMMASRHNFVRFSFRKGGQSEFLSGYQQQLSKKLWELPQIKALPSKPVAQARTARGAPARSGIMGIERTMEAKRLETDKTISEAFQDLNALMEKAKQMVSLAESVTRKLEEKKGSLTDDETTALKSYLLSVGIANPVTRETHGSGATYHRELAKQLSVFLQEQLKDTGGIMTMQDIYCRFNRARGMELVSPEDLVNACQNFQSLQLPMRLRKFDSGVLVVELLSHDEANLLSDLQSQVTDATSMSADELSQLADISIMLAKERLLLGESKGLLCRDDSVEGLRFYPNRFVEV